jgi:hypothetical protein
MTVTGLAVFSGGVGMRVPVMMTEGIVPTLLVSELADASCALVGTARNADNRMAARFGETDFCICWSL